jgi:hypothetical protein
MRSLMFQANLPPSYWVEALHTATYLLNRHPTKTLNFQTPYFALYGASPSYHHLRVFGCKCYPNLFATTPHKLAPRSTLCVFLGYPGPQGIPLPRLSHKGQAFLVTSLSVNLPFLLPSFLLLYLLLTLIFCRSLTMCIALFLHQLLQVQELQVQVSLALGCLPLPPMLLGLLPAGTWNFRPWS